MEAVMNQTAQADDDEIIIEKKPMTQTAQQPWNRAARKHLTVDELVKMPEFDYWTKSSLRHAIFNSRPRYSASGDVIAGNGMVEAGVLLRVGRKVLIDVARFREWLESHREIIQSP